MLQFASGYVVLMMVGSQLKMTLSDIHLSSVLKILRELLGLRKICVRWMPHMLTDEQKQSWVRLASQVIENMINVTHIIWKR